MQSPEISGSLGGDENGSALAQCDDMHKPRKPQRANGFRKYEHLVDAAARLIDELGVEALTVQAIARAADVPMASVYHFFPSAVAAAVAVAERHIAAFSSIADSFLSSEEPVSLDEALAALMRKTIRYYRRHASARELFLGSGYSWYVRQSDLANNATMSRGIVRKLSERYGIANSEENIAKIAIAISIGDSVWSMSLARTGKITAAYERESIAAVTAYLKTSLQR